MIRGGGRVGWTKSVVERRAGTSVNSGNNRLAKEKKMEVLKSKERTKFSRGEQGMSVNSLSGQNRSIVARIEGTSVKSLSGKDSWIVVRRAWASVKLGCRMRSGDVGQPGQQSIGWGKKDAGRQLGGSLDRRIKSGDVGQPGQQSICPGIVKSGKVWSRQLSQEMEWIQLLLRSSVSQNNYNPITKMLMNATVPQQQSKHNLHFQVSESKRVTTLRYCI